MSRLGAGTGGVSFGRLEGTGGGGPLGSTLGLLGMSGGTPAGDALGTAGGGPLGGSVCSSSALEDILGRGLGTGASSMAREDKLVSLLFRGGLEVVNSCLDMSWELLVLAIGFVLVGLVSLDCRRGAGIGASDGVDAELGLLEAA